MDTRKNLLDLDYQEFVQYHTTTIVITFTYLIGIFIAFITNQLNIRNNDQMIFVLAMSTIIICTTTIIILNLNSKLKNIKSEIKNLN